MKNCVGALKLLRLMPRTLSSSTDLMWGDITSVDDGMEIEMCFRELLKPTRPYLALIFSGVAGSFGNIRRQLSSDVAGHSFSCIKAQKAFNFVVRSSINMIVMNRDLKKNNNNV